MVSTGEKAKPALDNKSSDSSQSKCNTIIKESIVCFCG